ncbi:ATP-binding protein [Amycolatopsis sp. cmx-4-83]|uniref:ATP-binding protein n=1 Tax=Amycolatopsis sp. cmx-4-83 TaxID=2790940 RepID=UPI00397823CD
MQRESKTPRPAPVPHRLPPAADSFFAREELLTTLDAKRAAGTPVLVITGMAGVGKTSLALEWARRRIDQFPDGQLYVDLRGYSPAEPLPAGTAVRGLLDDLEVPSSRVPEDPAAQLGLYRSLIAGKRMLIILDNASTAAQIIPLLPRTASSTVVVTSRRPLTELTARYGAGRFDLQLLPAAESRAMLAHLVGAERVAAEPQAIDDLSRACAGLPLALSLVASAARSRGRQPLAELAAELRAVPALENDEPELGVRSVLSWSYRALPAEVARTFRLLSLLPGPDFGINAAATLGERSIDQARAVLEALELGSLVTSQVPGRYGLHDLIRAYALEQTLSLDGEAARSDARNRVIDFYLHTAKDANQQLSQRKERLELGQLSPGTIPLPLADATEALAWFDTEYNCLLPVQRLASTLGRYNAVWQLAIAMDTYLQRKGSLDDRLASWRTALEAAEQLGEPGPLALALRVLGDACSRSGRHAEALDFAQRCLDLSESVGATEQTDAHRTLAMIWERQGNRRRALDHALRALDRVRSLGDGFSEAEVLNAVGRYAARLGHFDQARDHCSAAQELHRYHPDRAGEADTLDTLGYLARHSDQYRQALTLYGDALRLRRDLRDFYQVANTLRIVGEIHADTGEFDAARRCWAEAGELFTAQGRLDEAADTRHRMDASRRATASDAEEITVFTSGDEGQPVRDALVDLLEIAGFSIVSRDVPEHGSWFQRLFVTKKDPQAGEELGRIVATAVANHLAGTVNGKVVQARDISIRNEPGAGQNEQEANAIARLLDACQVHDEIVLCTSSTVLVKVDGRITCWVPTAEAMRVLRTDPRLMRSPKELLDVLSRLSDSTARAHFADDLPRAES